MGEAGENKGLKGKEWRIREKSNQGPHRSAGEIYGRTLLASSGGRCCED